MEISITKLQIDELIIKKVVIETIETVAPVTPVTQTSNIVHVVGSNLAPAFLSAEAFKQHLEVESNMTNVVVDLFEINTGVVTINFTATGESLNLQRLGIEDITGDLTHVQDLKYLILAENEMTKINGITLPDTVVFISLDKAPFTPQSYDDSIDFANNLHDAPAQGSEIRLVNVTADATHTAFRQVLMDKGWAITQIITR